ncbi:hypothetical protein R4E38_02655 [Morganella morganii]|uniref:hypothetical protein n=1 Tax=Morganella morganii TaxID=582 RepID=UPI001BDAA1A3|nr:hypothetical protein [Morganella morganii]MBT0505046.1 hypothetical protein [Morganella morganii subsp. morganii]MDW7785715.1 hypothetical protein [Morganella morganii]QWM12583.1 hypothetical protein IZ182_07205 [Morganella morganii subsp. morganii]
MSAELITFIVALLAGVISILGLIISKESKISEFRQLWINDLRSALVKLNKNMFILQEMHIKGATEKEITNQKSNIKESISEVYLRINISKPNKDEIELINIIESIKSQLTHIPKIGLFECYETDLTNKSAAVLKGEWKRVKKGEVIYRVWSYIFTSIFFIMLLCAIISSIGL